MIERKELEHLYQNELQNNLKSLESLRKKVMRGQIIGFLVIVLAFILFIPVSAALEHLNEALPFILLAPMAILGIAILIRTYKINKLYRQQFKQEVVSKIIEAIDPTWEYVPDQSITSTEYLRSDLFRQSVDRFRGDDLIIGKIDKTDFRCSELHTEYKTVTTDKNGQTKETWHTIFRGLFFHADFNKVIKGKTYIEPDTAERLFGKLGQSLQMSTKGKLVKLENPEFEKIFAVFGTDQTEARYILTPTIMEALVNIYTKYKRKMYLSFTGTRVYVAITFNKNLFEPRIFSSGVNYKDIEFMYNLFEINQAIIQELNLNTRIWTKE